jgi:nucleoside-diphosphate-sugar epimerase
MRSALAGRGVPISTGGLLGWVHHVDVAAATVAALEAGRPGQAYNIVDDQPATWEEVFTRRNRGYGLRYLDRPAVLRPLVPATRR